MEEVDIAIIGSGVVGLAVSYALSGSNKNIVVIEKNASFGQEASSRNSEVIHAGIYYPKASLKTKTCIRGKELLYDLCARENIPHKKLGKLIVAFDNDGYKEIDRIYKNASDCGLKGLEILSEKEIKKLEPNVSAKKAMFSPDTGILDSHSFMAFLFKKAKERKVNFAFSVEVVGIKKEKNSYEIKVKEPQGEFFTFRVRLVINSAGLQSDKIAEFAGLDLDKNSYRLHYSKGQYFRIRNPKKFSIKHLIYPPPTKTDLGVHITPDLAGGLRLGPDARYVSGIDYSVDEKEKRTFSASVLKFLPALEEGDLIPDTAGIRAKLQKEGEAFRDFVINDEGEKGFPGFINLIGIESPGLTASLAISEIVKNIIDGY